MYSPALFSAVLLFTASGFSSALPADGTADGAAKADTAGSGDKPTECQTYHVKSGETCNGVVEKFKTNNPPLTLDDFLAFNPTINKECTNMLADHDYCVTKPGSAGGKKKGGKKSGSKPKHQNGHGGDQKQGASTNACDKWYTAVDGDTCYKIAHDKNVSWDDL